MRRYYGTVVAVAATVFAAAAARAEVRYVDIDATGAGTGVDWCNAFTNLRSVLQNTTFQPGDEVRVAAGTYRPANCVGLPPEFCTFRSNSFRAQD